jgi:hypothetical protein
MTHLNFCGFDSSSTVTPASPFGDLHRRAGAQIIPAEAGTQSFVSQPNGVLGLGLRRGDEGLIVTDIDLVNPSTHLPSQAKTPQTAIQMRGFKS